MYAHLLLLLLVLSLPLLAAAEPPSAALDKRATQPKASSGKLFSELDRSVSGIDFINPIDTKHPLKRLYTSAFGGGGVAAGDIDGDRRPDLYFVSGARENRLYRNLGDGEFADVTAAAGVGGGDAWGGGAAMVDVDGDGDLDIYVCNYETPNQLFLNDGKGKFTESARAFGLDQSGAFLMAAFADYDLDGDLDVYLLGHRFYRPRGRPGENVTVVKDGKLQMLPQFDDYYGIMWRGGKNFEINNVGASDLLLRNDGGRFTDVTAATGISLDRNQGNSVTWWDFNHDGLPDIYVGNDFEAPDLLYRNNGNGTFTDVIREQLPHTTWFTMGADCGDINNDGLMDFLAVDMAGTTHYKSKTTMGAMGANSWFMQNADPPQYMRNCLYLNTGAGRFMDAAPMAGLASSDWSWAVKFGDLDCDGWIDVFIANGMTRNFNDSDKPLDIAALVGKTEWDFYETTPARPERNLGFRNRGDLKFSNESEAWGLDRDGISYAAAYFDLEGDGDLDLAVANLDEPPTIHRNDGATGSRVVLRLEGAGKNRSGIGASIRIQTSAGQQIRQFNPMRGFSSCDQPLVHFGLGDATQIDELEVTWPGGKVSAFKNLAVDRLYTISETAASPARDQKAGKRQERALFEKSDALRGVRHWEMPFDDFALQPLLPNRLSQNGPGLAAGDVDGDGDDDLYLGGCAGYLGQLMINDGGGRFEPHTFTAGEAHRSSEDMGALFFDSDGDGDLDLYVVSGSVEAPPKHDSYLDRLYLNDGRGNYTLPDIELLPGNADSGSVVAAADYDRDGDLDLFVGGRVVPGQYPVTPKSRLLENRGGRFSDVTYKVPALGAAGMVTGALWSDADDDGWIDLLVSTEWGPVKFYRNREGLLLDATTDAGLAERLGWWTGISGGDFDRDGDIDYVVTNFGLNTKYKASPEAPELLYYGDIEGSGRSRLIEAGFEHGKLYPHRGLSCSRNAMPSIGAKFKTYHNFASSKLDDVYASERLEGARRFEANILASGILINDGDAKFSFRALPPLAQIAPAFGSVVIDADGDGELDIYLAQNFYGPQIETRPMNDGLSVLLVGDGDGNFAAVPPQESGLVVPEDAMSVITTDLSGDGRPDLVVGVNDGEPLAFESRTEAAPVALRLVGAKGNQAAIGARVMLSPPRGSNAQGLVAEVAASGGYLSQSGTTLYFPRSESARVASVRWPDGRRSEHAIEANATHVRLTQGSSE
ncbi:MAG: hypothetical protein ACI9UA_001472 [Pseudoalteromonas tetraodonis]|jgi:hypothetical protein